MIRRTAQARALYGAQPAPPSQPHQVDTKPILPAPSALGAQGGREGGGWLAADPTVRQVDGEPGREGRVLLLPPVLYVEERLYIKKVQCRKNQVYYAIYSRRKKNFN